MIFDNREEMNIEPPVKMNIDCSNDLHPKQRHAIDVLKAAERRVASNYFYPSEEDPIVAHHTMDQHDIILESIHVFSKKFIEE